MTNELWNIQKKEWERLLSQLVSKEAFHESDVFKTVGPFVEELIAAREQGREPQHSTRQKAEIKRLITSKARGVTPQSADMMDFLDMSMSDYLATE